MVVWNCRSDYLVAQWSDGWDVGLYANVTSQTQIWRKIYIAPLNQGAKGGRNKAMSGVGYEEGVPSVE